MTDLGPTLWTPDATGTLGELVAKSAVLLDLIGTNVADARVSGAPDARNIRYYQGLGLVDKPLRYDGRKAIYGRRHLVQVLAIKLLQSQGYALSQIQQATAAQPYEALERGVLQALGQPATPPPSTPTLREQTTFQVAPGVQVTIDPSLVDDPHELARRIQAFIHQAPSQPHQEQRP